MPCRAVWETTRLRQELEAVRENSFLCFLREEMGEAVYTAE